MNCKILMLAALANLMAGCDRVMPMIFKNAAMPGATTSTPALKKIIVVMAGQSNMIGTGQDENFDATPAVQMVDNGGGPAGMRGPGAAAGVWYTRTHPGVLFIGVMCAVGSTPIAEWAPGSPNLEACLTLARKMRDQEHARIVGMFWDQGEQDAVLGTPDWPQQLNTLVTYTRTSLGLTALPVIYSQLGQADNQATGYPYWDAIKQEQLQAQQPGFDMAPTDDLPVVAHVHHDKGANWEIGRRFFARMGDWQI